MHVLIVLLCTKPTPTVALSPGSLTLITGRDAKRRKGLLHIVCACANYLGYCACMRYSRKYIRASIMGVYKILKYPNVLEDLLVHGYARHDAAHTTANDGLLGHSLAKLVAI